MGELTVGKLRPKTKKRLFFALWPDDEVREQIAADAGRTIERSDGRTVPPSNYHITLTFLGSVTASSLPDIVAAARNVRVLPYRLLAPLTGGLAGSG